MQTTFTNTFEDYCEAVASYSTVDRAATKRYPFDQLDAILGIVFVLLCRFLLERQVPYLLGSSPPTTIAVDSLLLFVPPLLPLIWITARFYVQLFVYQDVPNRPRQPLGSAVIREYRPLNPSAPLRTAMGWVVVLLPALLFIGVIQILLRTDALARQTHSSSGSLRSIWIGPELLVVYPLVVWGIARLAKAHLKFRKDALVIRWIWDNHFSMGLPKAFEADEERFVIADSLSVLQHQWSGVRRFVETQSLFLLYVTDYLVYMIPKRSLAAEEALTFLELLRSSVGNGFILEHVQRPRG